jgi:hypothetical protein
MHPKRQNSLSKIGEQCNATVGVTLCTNPSLKKLLSSLSPPSFPDTHLPPSFPSISLSLPLTVIIPLPSISSLSRSRSVRHGSALKVGVSLSTRYLLSPSLFSRYPLLFPPFSLPPPLFPLETTFKRKRGMFQKECEYLETLFLCWVHYFFFFFFKFNLIYLLYICPYSSSFWFYSAAYDVWFWR